ncbi:TetR/AcrR family transcriptional regulator C-terminal domain-containing protein [Natronosporangium hydrolyticum]|uniref:TetR/AcrR family transcriptional regulator C-terminal domain-containing protein n=1 Tax=Natronosporangium hydrolyticum TaxID=2811111 RepID=A0A895YKD2_9ACTN|nr:TetR/AcrR family transcriptional regulator [Natronosporangium hydrolyticum]QSB16492.1 TetR/AcrR family transcriptional regulator C-terminal domain-containing protein [Natronosporangium hydrolyticum]
MARGLAGDPDHGVELLWGDRPRPAAPRRGLTLDQIVPAAIAVADADGLAGLSMRRVADRLGFTTMSLYRHVPGRDQLVNLMCDAVIEPPPAKTADGWRPQLAACARAGWQLRRRHPWLAEVRGTRHVPGPRAVAYFEHMLSVVADTNLTPSEMVAAVELVGRFVDAEALRLVEAAQEERRSGVTEQEWWSSRETLFARMDRYPTLSWLWEAGAYDEPADPFEFGLERVLDGVEVLVNRRDETRNETCPTCGGPVAQPTNGRRRAYCSPACRQRAYRSRRS